MKSKIFKILLFLALILLPLGSAQAMDSKTGNSIYVTKDEIVSGTFYAVGNTVTIDGAITGDLLAIGQTINVNGEVGGNIRVAGNAISLNGTVARNVNALGANIILGDKAKVGWDVYVAGNNLEMRGVVDGSLNSHIGQALISGKIGQDADLKLASKMANQNLIISSGAIINGDLTYTSKTPAEISDQASISGQTTQNLPPVTSKNWFAAWAWTKLFGIFSAILVGLILVFLLKKLTPKILEKIEEKPLKVFIPGLILTFILPPIALVLCFTLIGTPLALIIMAWWFVATYIAKIFIAILVGKLIIKKISKKDNVHLFWSLALGVIICWLLFAIPFVGWILCLIAIWLGLGGIYTYATHQLRNL